MKTNFLQGISMSTNDKLPSMMRMLCLLIFTIAISSCSDKSVSGRLVFEKDYILKNANQKLSIRIHPEDFNHTTVNPLDGTISISQLEGMLYIRNIGTSNIKCLSEIICSFPVKNNPDGIQKIYITFRNDYSQDNDSDTDTVVKQIKGKEIITGNKVGIIELEVNEKIQIPMGYLSKGQEYKIHLNWF